MGTGEVATLDNVATARIFCSVRGTSRTASSIAGTIIMPILRRLRGLLSLSLLWAAAWVPVGLSIFFVVEGVILKREIVWEHIPTLAVRLAIVGGICGCAFGLLIAAIERRRTFGSLSFRRMAVWGALAGCAFPAVLLSTTKITIGSTEAIVFSIFGSLGMLTSVGSLALARRAPALVEGVSQTLGSGTDP
jgi:hypothetical protein